ncbi:MAG: M20 aminoacylase family protein [Rhodospirillales bacterium]
MSPRVYEISSSLHELMVAFRHDFHRHPELGFQETRTAARIAEALESWGLQVHRGRGVVGVLTAGRSTRTIALRAEMDALPIQETSDLAHASSVEGVMHGCGHDGHMAMLLGAAKQLSEAPDFDGRVVFVFQPNEENGLGAKAMLNEEIVKRFAIEEIYALHNLPGAPLGEISTRAGLICSSESLFEIEIEGQGGHASMPHVGGDTLLVGAEVVQALQAIVARKLPPAAGAVVSVTEFITNGARNVLPSRVLLKGDARARSPQDRERIEELMRRIVAGVELGQDVKIRVGFNTEFLETINDARCAATAIEVARRVTDQVRGDRQPLSFSEDFSHFLSAVPGCFLLIGNGTEGAHGRPLHASSYDFNDALLTVGAAFWMALVTDRLATRTN